MKLGDCVLLWGAIITLWIYTGAPWSLLVAFAVAAFLLNFVQELVRYMRS